MVSMKWKIFELYSNLLFLDFPTRRRIHISHFLDFSPSLFFSRSTTDLARNRNEFALGPALFFLGNTLSSDISCEKLSQVIRVSFRVYYISVRLTLLLLIFWCIKWRQKSRKYDYAIHFFIHLSFIDRFIKQSRKKNFTRRRKSHHTKRDKWKNESNSLFREWNMPEDSVPKSTSKVKNLQSSSKHRNCKQRTLDEESSLANSAPESVASTTLIIADYETVLLLDKVTVNSIFFSIFVAVFTTITIPQNLIYVFFLLFGIRLFLFDLDLFFNTWL